MRKRFPSKIPSVLAFLVMALAASLPAYGQAEIRWVNMSPEGRVVAKKLEIDGGSVVAYGGLLVSPQILTPLFGNPVVVGDKISVSLVLRLINRSPNTVWVEFEVQAPGATKSGKQSKELKSGFELWHSWKLDDVKWDTPHPVSITVYGDKKRTKSLTSLSASFVFESGDRERVEEAKQTAQEQLGQGRPARILISGWPENMSEEEMAAAKKAKEERDPVPSFEWNEKEGSPGVTLTAAELRRYSGGGAKLIDYDLRASGFSADEELTLWIRWLDSKYMKLPFPMRVDEKGILQGTHEGKTMGFHSTVGKMVPGEPISWALVSNTAQKRAYARAVPFPIEARGAGGCSVSAELQAPNALLFLVTMRGFSPGEEVAVTSEFKKEKLPHTPKVDENGEASVPILFGPGDRGKAIFTAVGKSCSVSLAYKVGPDALVIQ